MAFDIIDAQILGESHSERMTLNFFGLEEGGEFKGDSVLDMLERRKSNRSPWSTPRMEEDEAVFRSGLKETERGEIRPEAGKTYTLNGDVVSAYVKNENVKKGDYADISSIPRPSHADFVQYVKDGKIASGGGRFSGRLTTMLCIAGGIAEDLLRKQGIEVVAYVSSIKDKNLGSYRDGADLNGFDKKTVERLKNDNFPTLDESGKESAIDLIKQAAKEGDSVGGTIECVVLGVKAGSLGDNLASGLEGKIAYSVFGVPAVKGVEFGFGFDLAKSTGSEANDGFEIKDGKVVTSTNGSGGINGGVANGMPITLRVAIRPTPSISKEQSSVNLATKENCKLDIKGRHDACIVPRAVPCVESAVALAILDELLLAKIAKEKL
ncbi:MAG: chorismate synthase [Clostridia bacterium]|nr:chorismate synthase [Clostridia bacterium]